MHSTDQWSFAKGCFLALACGAAVLLLAGCAGAETPAAASTPTITRAASKTVAVTSPATDTLRPPSLTPSEARAEDTSRPKAIQLTGDDENCVFPSWSPDGRSLVFSRESDLATIPSTGGGVHILRIMVPTWGADWSPDGRQLAFAKKAGTELYVSGIDGSGLKQIDGAPLYLKYPWYHWSPDGRILAWIATVNGQTELWVWGEQSGKSRSLGRVASQLRWVHWMGYQSIDVYAEAAGSLTVKRICLESCRQSLPSIPLPAGATKTIFSPDGTRFVVAAPSADGAGETLSVRTVSDSTVLSVLPKGAEDPSWSPDGKRIAFGVPETGKNDLVHVVNADGSGLITIATRGHDYPGGYVWSPDGGKIAYVSQSENPRILHVFAIDQHSWKVINLQYPMIYTYYHEAMDFKNGPRSSDIVVIEEWRIYSNSIYTVEVPTG